MPPNRFESEVGNFLEGSHGDRTHIKRAGHHTVTPLCGTLLRVQLPGFRHPPAPQPGPPAPCSALDTGSGGDFAPCEALWRRVAGVSHPCMAQFPPFGSGAAVVCSGVALKSQTTSVKNTENGLLVAKWSALWAQRCLAWCACSHANPLLRV